MKKPLYTVVDLFSGAGGMSLGFEKPELLNGLGNLGYERIGHRTQTFKSILAIDKYEHAAETYSLNFDADVIQDNIENIDSFTRWNDADVVIGAPPCQGFSNLNSTKTEDLNDERNQLWREFLRAVDDIDPDVFLLENVPRFLNSQSAVNAVGKAEQMGYTTVVDIMNAERYGVPQTRKRGFILGSKLGTPFFPAPPQTEVKTVRDAIADLPRNPTDKNLHIGRDVEDRTKLRMESIPPGGNRFDIPEDLKNDCWKGYEKGSTDVYGRLWWERPAVTIRTEFVKPEKGRYLHPDEDRSITMREGARFQTFPDCFSFNNSYKVHVTQLVGNAVPPKLSYHLSLAIKAHLEGVNGVSMDAEDGESQNLLKAERESENTLTRFERRSVSAKADD